MAAFLNIFKKISRTPTLHVLGDSHSSVFEHIQIPDYTIQTCTVVGATASGLINPHSTTGTRTILTQYLKTKTKKKDRILLMLGEVDCGFVIWLRSQKQGITIGEQLAYTLNNYYLFIEECKKFSNKPLMIISSLLPTIKDGVTFGEVANLRKEVKATQLERTNLTRKFNSELKNYCQAHNHIFVSLDEALIDKSTNLIKDYYLNPDVTDHHLDSSKLAPVITNLLLPYL